MTPVYDFTWRGQSAHANHGVEVMKIGSTVIAERRDTTFVIAGRSGLVHDQDGAVEEVERQLELYLPYTQGRPVSDFATIRNWLKGYGKLTLSTIPDRYMMAYITDQIALDPIVEGFADLQGKVIFRCEPYLYLDNVPDIVLTDHAVITNAHTCESRPVITLEATGDIDLMIGNQTVLLTDLTEPIIINSVIDEAYTVGTDGKLYNANNLMSGDFPVLPVGTVPISWDLGEDATLTRITIQPNWRDEN